MGKVFKWILIALGGLVALILVAATGLYLVSEGRLNRTFNVPEAEIRFQNDPEIVAAGQHVAAIRGCLDCHGSDLGGAEVFSEPGIATIFAPNLTAGQGGVIGTYSDADFERAIRHGVRPDGTALLVMPSQEYFVLSDADLNALVAYIRNVPAVDRATPSKSISVVGRALYMAGVLPPAAAEIIDHQVPHPDAPNVAADAEYGAYLAVSCTGCHGLDFRGGNPPGSPPGAPPAADLTPAGNLAGWEEAGFIRALRTGQTPDGASLDPAEMPWPMTAQMTDLELRALWAFFQDLPAPSSAVQQPNAE
jgi:mono/diheme cytochrome c family protein